MTEEQLQSLEQWASCDLREGDGREVHQLVDEVRDSRLQARPQHDPGAHVFMREAIELLRRVRGPLKHDLHDIRRGRCDETTIVAHNLREAYEWLWPMLWTDDSEFVPFSERTRP